MVAPELFTAAQPPAGPPVVERLVAVEPAPPQPLEAALPSLAEPVQKPAAEVAPERLASDTRVFTIEGVDQLGRKASFEMIVLSRAIAWTRGSTTELARAGEPLSEAQVADEVFGPDVRDRLVLTSELIAAGAASAEGDVDTETERAEKRARTTAGWLSAAAPGKTVWTLNLGQYQTSCESAAAASDTGWQRPLIVFGVRSKDAGVQLDQALSNAMTGKANLPSPSCYSSFELEPYR